MRSIIFALLGSGLALLATCDAQAQAAAQVCSTPQLAFGGLSGTPVSTTDTMFVPDNIAIGDLQVTMQITHAWAGEIDLELTSPAGTKLVLQTGDIGNPNGIDLVYSDGGVPYGSQPFDFGCHMQAAGGSFSVFSGQNSQGTWTLQVADDSPAWNDGVLESWCVTFFTAPQAAPPWPVLSLTYSPTADGTHLTWTNGATYSSIDVLVNGATFASLSGTATSYTVTSQPAGVLVEVQVQGTTPGGATSCPVGRAVIPLGPPLVPKAEKVVLVMIDGMRYSEGFGDPSRVHIPRMAALAAEGTIIEPFRCDGKPVTLSALPAIVCGSWDPAVRFFNAACGSNSLYMARPTVNEYFRQQLNRPASDCQYVIGVITCPWSESFHHSYGNSYAPQWVATTGLDKDVFAAVKVAIANDEPSLLTVYLHDVDGAGHTGNWGKYIAAIENADQIVGDLWDVLQADPAYAGKTTMLVTNDHGRHYYDFKGHGDGCYGCRDIQLLAIGPPILRGHVSTVPRAIPDITPTIGALLGFHTEYADGEVMSEIFSICQPDLGFGGPGSIALSVCGQTLESGNKAFLSLTGGSPNAASLAVISLTSNPTPFLGGTLATFPIAATLPLFLDTAGELSLTLPGGFAPQKIYVQFAVEDLAQKQGAALSNAVQLEFLP